MEREGNDEDNESSGSQSEDEEDMPEMLAPNRERRVNAGAKMGDLLDKEDTDDFYQATYGGFFEEDNDVAFNSPVHSDQDEVDSDFDRPESEDEPISDEEGDTIGKRKRLTAIGVYKEPKLKKTISGNQYPSLKPRRRDAPKRRSNRIENSAVFEARFRPSTISKSQQMRITETAKKTLVTKLRDFNSCGVAKRHHRHHRHISQEQLLNEAKKTEKDNTNSLKRYEQYEIEQKRKRENAIKPRRSDGPKISFISLTMPVATDTAQTDDKNSRHLCSRTFVRFPDAASLDRNVHRREARPELRRDTLCCVSGQPGRYRDPVTGLPFANRDAFRELRRAYRSFLADRAHSDPQIAQYLACTSSSD